MTVREALPFRRVRYLPAIGRFARAHWPFAIVLITGVVLRVITMLGYPGPAWFGDSATYLGCALHLTPSLVRPSGYSVFLWLLKPAHNLSLVVIVQHALGVAVGVLAYALVWHTAKAAGVRRNWPAALLGVLVAVPVLLDASLIQLEQMLMADELFVFLAVAAVTFALWRARPHWWMGAAAGLLLGLGAVTRSVGLPLLVVLVVCLLVRRAGLLPIVVAIVAFAVPLFSYGLWFKSEYGKFALTNSDHILLYGRAVGFADCAKMKPKPDVAVLCTDDMARDPRVAAPAYQAMWTNASPLHKVPGGMGGDEANRLAGEFAWLAIRTQPGDYAQIVWRDTVRSFEWGREPYPTTWTVKEYDFQPTPNQPAGYLAQVAGEYGGSTVNPQVVEPYAGWIRGYQSWAHVRGTILGIILLLGLGGIAAHWRRWGGPALLPWLTSVALLVVPAATADFDYRYLLPALIFAALAAGLSLIRPPAQSTTKAPDPATSDPALDPALEPALERAPSDPAPVEEGSSSTP